ncbi:hypothetical protein Q9Q99_18600 [Curtobacterium flaccumfaciens]|nr:hypothetical protein Q9Q99_18600 [Curtobacterium flaccumfaciens]
MSGAHVSTAHVTGPVDGTRALDVPADGGGSTGGREARLPSAASPRVRRVVGLVDTDSFAKWGAHLLATAPADWDLELRTVATPRSASPKQLRSAFRGLDRRLAHLHREPPAPKDVDAAVEELRQDPPDAVLVSLIGPVAELVIDEVHRRIPDRPVLVSGLPGISFPAKWKGIFFRARADLFVLHSHREVRAYEELAREGGVEPHFALATLPFARGCRRDRRYRRDGRDRPRLRRLRGAAECAARAGRPGPRRALARRHGPRAPGVARRHQDPRRGRRAPDAPRGAPVPGPGAGGRPGQPGGGERPDGRPPRPRGGTRDDQFDGRPRGCGPGCPRAHAHRLRDRAAPDQRGVRGEWPRGGRRRPGRRPVQGPSGREWMRDNYFHPAAEDDWQRRLVDLMARRDAGRLVDRAPARRSRGGALRRAWERKNALGGADRSPLGLVALGIGAPIRSAKRLARRMRALIDPPEPVVVSAPTSQRAGGRAAAPASGAAAAAARSERLGHREQELVPGRDAG